MAMDFEVIILRELYSLWQEKGPKNFFAVKTLKCFKSGNRDLGLALNKLSAKNFILTTKFDADGEKDLAAIALNPEKIVDVEKAIGKAPAENSIGFGKIVVLLILLSIALTGFVTLKDTVPGMLMWLLFFVIAVPPVWAMIFESGKLEGKDLLTLYTIGLRSISSLKNLLIKQA